MDRPISQLYIVGAIFFAASTKKPTSHGPILYHQEVLVLLYFELKFWGRGSATDDPSASDSDEHW